MALVNIQMQHPPPRFVNQYSQPPGPPRMYHSPRFQNYQPRPYFNPAAKQMNAGGESTFQNAAYNGKQMRKAIYRKTVDYNAPIVRHLENRIWQRDYRDHRAIMSDFLYQPDWTPEGRRLVTGASSGEFTLWSGLTFNFETILQAHDAPVRSMVWSHNDSWMVTGDHTGFIKYWQSNMNNVKMYQAHKEAIRGISFCPSDAKFATCSDDSTVRIWDFMRCTEERILRGHGADVKCVAWHPQKCMMISGSKDSQQPIKLWDPRTGTGLATLHAHKNTCMDVKWNKNGHWFVTASRDHLLKLFDIRNLKEELQTFKGHKKEVICANWHPLHETLLVSGAADGCVMFWNVGIDKEVGAIEKAHEGMIWETTWHPMGHILASGSNDHTTKFWTRNRPGDKMRDRYNLNTLPSGVLDDNEYDDNTEGNIPGMGQVEQVKAQETEEANNDFTIPGLQLTEEDKAAITKEEVRARTVFKKPIVNKPVPHRFQENWETGKQTPAMKDDDDGDSKDLLGAPLKLADEEESTIPQEQKDMMLQQRAAAQQHLKMMQQKMMNPNSAEEESKTIPLPPAVISMPQQMMMQQSQPNMMGQMQQPLLGNMPAGMMNPMQAGNMMGMPGILPHPGMMTNMQGMGQPSGISSHDVDIRVKDRDDRVKDIDHRPRDQDLRRRPSDVDERNSYRDYQNWQDNYDDHGFASHDEDLRFNHMGDVDRRLPQRGGRGGMRGGSRGDRDERGTANMFHRQENKNRQSSSEDRDERSKPPSLFAREFRSPPGAPSNGSFDAPESSSAENKSGLIFDDRTGRLMVKKPKNNESNNEQSSKPPSLLSRDIPHPTSLGGPRKRIWDEGPGGNDIDEMDVDFRLQQQPSWNENESDNLPTRGGFRGHGRGDSPYRGRGGRGGIERGRGMGGERGRGSLRGIDRGRGLLDRGRGRGDRGRGRGPWRGNRGGI